MATDRAEAILIELERLVGELRRELAAVATEQKPRRGAHDLVQAAENWVRGLGWDETYDEAMVREELERLERRLNEELSPERRERLLDQWREERARRYPAAA